VEMHGGHISAASEGNGKGAAFMIELPTLAGVTAAPPEDGLRDQYCDLSGTKVLYVDDEFDARLFVRAVLEHCGADVKDCASAAEALVTLSDWRPDVILTDIAMPGISGYELAAQAKLIRPRLRVLYTTGYDGNAPGREMAAHHGRVAADHRPGGGTVNILTGVHTCFSRMRRTTS